MRCRGDVLTLEGHKLIEPRSVKRRPLLLMLLSLDKLLELLLLMMVELRRATCGESLVVSSSEGRCAHVGMRVTAYRRSVGILHSAARVAVLALHLQHLRRIQVKLALKLISILKLLHALTHVHLPELAGIRPSLRPHVELLRVCSPRLAMIIKTLLLLLLLLLLNMELKMQLQLPLSVSVLFLIGSRALVPRVAVGYCGCV